MAGSIDYFPSPEETGLANPEHLEILGQGVEAWNEWRKKNPAIIPDLRRAELRGASLASANLRTTVLAWADLSAADLSGANLSNSSLFQASLADAQLPFTKLIDTELNYANLERANLSYATLSYARLENANLNSTNLFTADLKKANLMQAKLNGAALAPADLTDAVAWGADFYKAEIIGANFARASLLRAGFEKAHLLRVNLSGANLKNAALVQAYVRDSNFSNSNLQNAQLGLSDFRNVKMEGVNLSEAALFRTGFHDTDMSAATGLETVNHLASSTIGIDTIFKSKGNIPEVFLRGCGVPDEFITYMRSPVSNPIQFYSCFISYSSKDQDFADRLHADLQSKGVRCWFAPEDLKIGDRIRDRIDESIRLRDKLLLILSENSIASDWVEHEVESALEEERRTGRTILFPIRLDDAVMDSGKAWAALIRRTRHIGDFTRWKDHDSYQKAFDRLLRDLKAEEKKV